MSVQQTTSGSPPIIPFPGKASFPGMLRGEWLKIARLFSIMQVLLVLGLMLAFWLGSIAPGVKTDLQRTPLHYLYYSSESNLVVVRILGGIVLLILSSLVVGREYHYGTIRI